MNKSKIAIGSEHAGYKYKNEIKKELKTKGYEVVDFGIYEEKVCDNYPLIAEKVALSVTSGQTDKGILICGTGMGMCISANKIPGARAALCYNFYAAEKSRQHNDSNVLVLGSRVVGLEYTKEIVSLWLKTNFESGRHLERVGQINKLDVKYRRK